MSITGSHENALSTRVHNRLSNGAEIYKSNYILETKNGGIDPNCKLIEQFPNSEVRAHFHGANQFQIFLDGEARLGKHELHGITVHYTSAYTPYGPIMAGENGIKYFTIRTIYDSGAKYLPEERAKLMHVQRRFITESIDRRDPVSVGSLVEMPVIEPQADGVAASIAWLPPGSIWKGADPAGSGGLFHVITRGAVQYQDQEFPAYGCIYVAPGDDAVSLVAGSEGAEVVTTRFAADDAASKN